MAGTRKKDKKNIGIIIVFAVILSVVTIMNTLLVFRMTSKQTRDEGEYQIQTISGELENTINAAIRQTVEIAVDTRGYLDDKEALKEHIVELKQKLTEESNGLCYNIYIAGSDWDIIPDLEKPENFVATERSWYKGAIKNAGTAYVTSPYVDAWTGNICYSISVELGDGDTVIGVDYTIENIQKYIIQIADNGNQQPIIVTEDGIVAGYAEEELIGKRLTEAIPEYAGALSKAKEADGVIASKLGSGITADYVFAARTSTGFYLMVSENVWTLYKKSYAQLAFTILLSLLLFVIIITLYVITKKNQEKAEQALSSKDDFLKRISTELRNPLNSIITSASANDLRHSDDFEQEITKIKNAGEKLSSMLDQITSYSSIVQKEKLDVGNGQAANRKMSLRFRNAIISVLVVIMIFSCYVNISTTYKWGKVSMQGEVKNYESQLSEWVNTQKSILDMFCSFVSTNPEILNDYEGAVERLNEITIQYPEISVTYMTNPEFEHTVIMNNGWEPEADWHVEERQWYIDTMASPDGWSISAPYYDEQTGYYCITLSESVYDAKTGEFLGNFGIDFYMDKLIDILGASYTDDGYAFLVDAEGEIINHPYGLYQMSVDHITNVDDLSYSDTKANGKDTKLFKDYDGVKKIIIASKDSASGFSVYVVSSVWKIYGRVILYAMVCIISFVICLIVIYRIIANLFKWQGTVNKKLEDAAETAIAAGNAKSQFLAQMSHEIRTPINAVLGMNEMVLRESTNDNITEYANNIQRAGKTLLELINSILDFSKIEDGKMEIIPVNYDVASVINDLVNAILERANSKGLEFKVEIDNNLPAYLFGDDVRIRQVITNLLTNAVKYTEKGSVTFVMKEMSRQDDNIDIYVAVKDTGIGIREEDKAKLFESFQRIEEKRNRNIEGTGLGISIVTKLLDMMGSKLEVESVYGEGSVFSFVISQGIENAEPLGDYQKRIELGRSNQQVERYLYAPDARILLVDDNEINLKVAKNLMKRNGFVPDTVNSGFDAVNLVKKNQYDIIFLDHMMPKMDGIETLNLMREEKLLPSNTKVIVLTANAIVGAKDEYLAAGFDDYLSKPIETEKLEKQLAHYLPKRLVTYKVDEHGEKADKPGEKADKPEQNLSEKETKAVDTQSTEKAEQQHKVQAVVAMEENSGEAGFTMKELKEWYEKCPELNVMLGLTYCIEDKEFYTETIQMYVDEDKRETLNKAFADEDYNNYRIAVHALKSTSLTIGLSLLSEHARLLEMAAKNNDVAYIKENHESVMNEYGNILDKLKAII